MTIENILLFSAILAGGIIVILLILLLVRSIYEGAILLFLMVGLRSDLHLILYIAAWIGMFPLMIVISLIFRVMLPNPND